MSTFSTSFHADLNPAYPSKGQRRYAIWRVESTPVRTGGARIERFQLGRQFNSLKAAEEWARYLTRDQWRDEAKRRNTYLGD